MMKGDKPVEPSSAKPNTQPSTESSPPSERSCLACPDPLPSASTVDSPVRSEEVSAPSGVQEVATSSISEGPPSSATSEAVEAPGADGVPTLSYAEFYAQYAAQLAAYSSERQPSSSQSLDAPPELCDCKRELVKQWLQRPARRQVEATELESTCHFEGQNEYNIWYGRHLTDRHSRTGHSDREAALYCCDPELDSGYTMADTQPGCSEGYFCAFFAKGCCTKGSECRYKHRIPTLEDEGSLEWSKDIFGRDRHKEHREDMGGAGSFNHECKTLFVSGLQVDPKEADGLRCLEKFLWERFGAWGDLISVRVIPKKLIGFVTYAYRVQAEFAKVAMADQNCGKYGSLLTVKWAYQDSNAKRRNENDLEQVVKKLKTGEEASRSSSNTTAAGEEEVVRQTLNSYCKAWQTYWASVYGCQQYASTASGVQGSSAQHSHAFFTNFNGLGTQHDGGMTAEGGQWPNEQPAHDAEESVQRLASVLSRVEGLSATDFLKAAAVATPPSDNRS